MYSLLNTIQQAFRILLLKPLWTPCKDSALSPAFCHSPLPRLSPFFAVLNSSLPWTVLYKGVNPQRVAERRLEPSAVPSPFSPVQLTAG